MNEIPFIDLSTLAKLFGALLLSLPLALNREKAQRTAGLRTFTIVAVTSCGFMMTGLRFLEDSDLSARLMQGLIGGLGFLGGGAILKTSDSIKGMATAASIWSAGAIGMATAFAQWEVAFFISLVTWLTLHFGSDVKESIDSPDRKECD